VLQYKQELQNMNNEKPVWYNVFQLKFGQVYSVWKIFTSRRPFFHISDTQTFAAGKTARVICTYEKFLI
jgi:hypothetical protein